jgi:hypothetical protein
VNSSFFYNSSLHPYRSNEKVVVRYCGVPIFGTSNTAQTQADGVMIYGDILNGKTYTPEWSMSPFDATRLEGYIGLFFFDSTSDSFKPLASLYYSEGSGNQGVNYDLLNVDFSSLLRKSKSNYLVNPITVSDGTCFCSSEFSTHLFVVDIVQINGKDMHIAAYRVRSTFEYVTNVRTEYPTNKYSPDLFLVRGTSADAWKTLWSSEIAVMVCTIVFQVAANVSIAYILYKPVSALVAYLHEKGWSPSKAGRAVAHARRSREQSQKDVSTDARTTMFAGGDSIIS